MTTKREMEQRHHMFNALQSLGFTFDECERLRRISMTLHRWHERECGTENGCIERDETSGKAYWLNSHSGKRYPIRDMEKGAQKRLLGIINALATRKGVCDVNAYIQGDPRGAALYILRPGDVPAGESADSYYSRGICVY